MQLSTEITLTWNCVAGDGGIFRGIGCSIPSPDSDGGIFRGIGCSIPSPDSLTFSLKSGVDASRGAIDCFTGVSTT